MSCASEKFPENCNIPDVKTFQYSRKRPENARRVDVSTTGILMHPDVFDDNFRTFFFYRDFPLFLTDACPYLFKNNFMISLYNKPELSLTFLKTDTIIISDLIKMRIILKVKSTGISRKPITEIIKRIIVSRIK